MSGWSLLAGVAAFGIGAGIAWLRRGKPRYLAALEYWVYLPTESLPPQHVLMHRMSHHNPYRREDGPAIGAKEGILFSDTRLQMSLVLRKKNPHVFRPDLFEEYIEPTAEQLEALAESVAFAKIQYVSEAKLASDAHLQFLPHAAMAIAGLGKSRVIYDVYGERLLNPAELDAMLGRDGDATRAEVHVQVIWVPEAEGGYAATKGLVKLGLQELRTVSVGIDQQVLARQVLEEAGRRVWAGRSTPTSLEIPFYEDVFLLTLVPMPKGPTLVRMQRVQQR